MIYTLAQAADVIGREISIETLELIGQGNHSQAFCVNGEMVVKLPKHRKASQCLQTEIRVLRGLEHRLPLAVPNVLLTCTYAWGGEEFVWFASRRLAGKKLSKQEFLALDGPTTAANADSIADFLRRLHGQRDIFPIRRRDLCLLHGDFSLNHLLFDHHNMVCGVLDFADSRVGKPTSDFVYLLDDEDGEEFGAAFGKMVLGRYMSASSGGSYGISEKV